MFQRKYQNLDKHLEANKALVIYGPRQVGKTTLVKTYLKQTKKRYKLDSGDNIKVRQIIGSEDFSKIIDYVSGYDLYVIDEAQKIPNVGLGLKIIVDQVPGIEVLATGSSSFELSGQVGEPLTGRKKTLTLFPISQGELTPAVYNKGELKEKLAEILVFGSYPAVIGTSKEKRKQRLDEIVDSYLLKDVLELEKVKGSKVLLDLLRLVAFQIGGEVSLSELGQRVGLDYKTVGRYLDLLEKSFVLFNLRGFSRNLRTEITKKSKYYFWDNGIRNAIIANYNDLEIRDDVGKLWENFLVAERLKTREYKGIYANNYFWRSWEGQEVDWIEEREGKLFGYEFKYSAAKWRQPSGFRRAYPEAAVKVVNKENYLEFVG